jgi:hypothetical protein
MTHRNKAASTKRDKIGQVWNNMNYADRANWLHSGMGHSAWQSESWWGLPDSIREAFVTHVEATRAIYAYR